MLAPYIGYLITFSVVAFVLYGVDKRRAIFGKWRIPEATLLGFSFFGGGFGGYLGMLSFRHKTLKPKFHIVNLLAIVWQTALLIYLIKNPTFLA